jgi:biopolymer transport protein ExbB
MQGNLTSVSRLACWVLAAAVVFATIATWESGALGQQTNGNVPATQPDDTANQPVDEETQTAEPDKSLGMLVVESGWFSWIFYLILFAFSIVAFMVALERFLNLTREKVIPVTFTDALRGLVSRDDASAESYRNLANSSVSPIGRILKAGVLRAGRPLPEVEKSMEDALSREMASMRSRNRPLSVVGNIAPLVGLLGTVVGMIFAFSTASQVGLGKADELAKGIYLALLTTAGGLTIAIPSMLAAAWFGARAERFMREIDEILLETMPSFARMENRIVVERIPAESRVGAEAAEAPV